jgi:hypothetical protein
MSAHFEPSDLRVVQQGQKSIHVHLIEFSEIDEIIEVNISGWMERAIEISGGKNVQVRITRSMARGDQLTEWAISWQ